MIEKTMTGVRVINKHDLEANWDASSFIPKQGEIVVYDVDNNYSYERFKIGDGIHTITELPFYATVDEVSMAVQQKTQVQIITWEDDD